jgi:hypothetical protein
MRTESFPTICGICLAPGEDLKMGFYYHTKFERSVAAEGGPGARVEKVSFWYCAEGHDEIHKAVMVEASRGIVQKLPLPFEQLFTWC